LYKTEKSPSSGEVAPLVARADGEVTIAVRRIDSGRERRRHVTAERAIINSPDGRKAILSTAPPA
jgi:hypothetical protein